MTPKACSGDGVRGCLVNIAPWQDRCLFCTRTVALRAHSADGLVPDEPTAGEQRLCEQCRQWWPLTAEFFVIRPDERRGNVWRSRSCHACRAEAAYSRRFPTVAVA